MSMLPLPPLVFLSAFVLMYFLENTISLLFAFGATFRRGGQKLSQNEYTFILLYFYNFVFRKCINIRER